MDSARTIGHDDRALLPGARLDLGGRSRYRWRMRPARTTLAVALLLLATGCTRPNPDYDQPFERDAGRADPDASGTVDAEPQRDFGTVEGERPVRFAVLPEIDGPVAEDEPFAVLIRPLDADGQPTQAFRGVLRLQSSLGDVSPAEIIVSDLPESASLRVAVRLNREGSAALLAEAWDQGRRVVGESLPIEVRHGRWQAGAVPVLSPGVEGSWDDWDTSMPDVREVNGVLNMMYRGRGRAPEDGLRRSAGIGRALRDPQTGAWSRFFREAVLSNEVLDDGSVIDLSAPCFLAMDDAWRLWVSGTQGWEAYVALSLSAQGAVWTAPSSGRALEANAHSDRPERWVFDPTVLRNEYGHFEMWYSIRYQDDSEGIGHAWSEDGANWTVDEANPVFEPEAGSWDSATVSSPVVLKDGSVYRMWYSGDAVAADAPSDSGAIGYATSTDGVHWVRSPDNPVLEPSGREGAFDAVRVAHPAVVSVAGELHLYFAGFDGRQWRIAAATRLPVGGE